MLAESFSAVDLPRWETLAIPVMGLASAALALVVGRVLLRRPTAVPSPPLPRERQPQRAASDPFVQGSALEKRKALRRDGNPIEVLVSDAEATAPPTRAWVIDRSTGGLCLSVFDPVAEGTVLSVKPKNANGVAPWVQVEVKNCRRESGGWEVGCQFVRTPPWSVLLLFG